MHYKILSLVTVFLKKIHKFMATAGVRRLAFFALVPFIYFALTVYYMGPSITHCTTITNGFGDNTAGPIWRATLPGDQSVVGSYTKMTNFPSGENLYSPVIFSLILQPIMYKVTSQIAGPVCGYNLLNILGFMSTSLMMFAFIYYLTRNRWIAFLAGYAVAFTPYFQVKIGGHPSYGFGVLLIAVIWAFMEVVKTRKKSRVVALSLLTAICFYFDPYFSLLVATILGPLLFVWLCVSARAIKKSNTERQRVWSEAKMLAASLAIILVLVAPLFYVLISQQNQIKSVTAGTRDNISEVAKLCSNWPQEYILPFPDSPIFALFDSFQSQVKSSLYGFSTCGIAEDSVGLGIGLLLVSFLGGVILIWEKLRGRAVRLSKILAYPPHLVVFGTFMIILTAFMIALPPVTVAGISTPSQQLISLTSIWRIISREFMVINIGVVILASVMLTYFAHSLRSHKNLLRIGAGLLLITLFMQYQVYGPFAGNEPVRFNYNDAPAAYEWLSKQNEIKAVAEYPIEKATEANSLGYYLTMQSIHKKPLLNSAINDVEQARTHSGLKNLADPQTVPSLRALGIDAIVIHGVSPKEIEMLPYLRVLYSGTHAPDGRLPESSAITNDFLVIAEIEGLTRQINTLGFMQELPRNSLIQTSAINWQYELPSNSVIAYTDLSKNQQTSKKNKYLDLNNSATACFDIKTATSETLSMLNIMNADTSVVLQRIPLGNNYESLVLNIKLGQRIELSNDKGHNMRMTNIGCKPL